MSQTWPSKDLTRTLNQLFNDLFDRTDTLQSTFSGTSAPSSPVEGQLYYNTTDKLLYKCTDATTPTWEKVGYIEDTSITQSKLKTSIGSVSTTSAANLTLPGGEYGFYPQLKVTDYVDGKITASITYQGHYHSYRSVIRLEPSTSETAYAQQRYVTSSGEVFWIFLLRDKSTGDIIAGYQAPDHPCFGNGNDPSLLPHPFCSYDPEKHEIIVINPSYEEIKMMKALCRPVQTGQPKLDLLELFHPHKGPDGKERPAIFGFDDKVEMEYPKKEITVGVVEDEDEKPLWLKEEAKIIKVDISKHQPEMVKVHPLKKLVDL